MAVVAGTLSRYFGKRFLGAVAAVFGGMFLLVAMIDCMELLRRASDIQTASVVDVVRVSLYRVPQIVERALPFCVLVAAMVCYLNLSRRMELVVARAAGISAWQFIAPAAIAALVIGALMTTVYNPISATLQERAKRLEDDLFGRQVAISQETGTFWLRQRGADGQSIVNAKSSRNQGLLLNGVTAFTFDADGRFQNRIEARSAVLQAGHWRLEDVRIFSDAAPVREQNSYLLSTNLSPEQVRERLATPETVPFWQLPTYIRSSERAGLAASGYRYQYYKLLGQPFLLLSMVLLAGAVSLRFFRFGGVQKLVLSGVIAGFLVYVLSKVSEDLANAELMHPAAAAWLPVLVGGLTGLVALLYQEDG